MSLLPVAEAQSRLLAFATPLGGESVTLDHCIGRWLSEDLVARRDQPWADLSAMDGYAIRHRDLPGPWSMAGESAAGGALPAALEAGRAMRIFTGAPLPAGADSVVMQEDIVRDGGEITLVEGTDVRARAHVRRRGSDFSAGDVLLTGGTRLGATQIALAALAGHGVLPVGRRPKIALLSTGSELVEPGTQAPADKLPSSNAVMLRAMLAALPCDVENLGIVPDSLSALTDAFDRARGADVVVSTGGASVGDHDLVRPALEAAGGSLDFWKIALRPGKPLIAGHLGRSIMLGLPGNPVSAFATATLFLLPLVRKLGGSLAPLPRTRLARLARDMGPGDGREGYLRAHLDGDVVDPFSDQDSAGTRTLAQANCFVIRPAGAPALTAGRMTGILSFAD